MASSEPGPAVVQSPNPESGPALVAARRASQAAARRDFRLRAYPPASEPDDSTGTAIVLAATRALLTAETRFDVGRILRTAVTDLGGEVVPARTAGPEAIPVDVTLGNGEPHLVAVDPLSVAALRLTHHLPALVQDSLTAAERCDHAQRREERAAVDALTGVGTRGEIGVRLGRAQDDDVVCLFDLDGFRNSTTPAAMRRVMKRFACSGRSCAPRYDPGTSAGGTAGTSSSSSSKSSPWAAHGTG